MERKKLVRSILGQVLGIGIGSWVGTVLGCGIGSLLVSAVFFAVKLAAQKRKDREAGS